jgi:hypothetical protein
VIARLHERFALDRPCRVVMRSCGRPEAAWIPERRELAVCYELVDALYLLGRRAKAIDAEETSGGRH